MNPPKTRVLLTDDDADSRELLHFLLRHSGFEAVATGNAQEALRIAKEQEFDAYVLDNWMPDVSGIELCEQIRAFDPHTPIVFFSGAAYQSDKEEAMKLGAQAYVTKPSSHEELIETILSVIKASRRNA